MSEGVTEKKKVIEPAVNTVVVKSAGEQTTPSGISVPSEGKRKPEIGTVYAVGKEKEPGDLTIPGLKEGDIIIYRRYADNEVFIGGDLFNFIDFKDLVGRKVV